MILTSVISSNESLNQLAATKAAASRSGVDIMTEINIPRLSKYWYLAGMVNNTFSFQFSLQQLSVSLKTEQSDIAANQKVDIGP